MLTTYIVRTKDFNKVPYSDCYVGLYAARDPEALADYMAEVDDRLEFEYREAPATGVILNCESLTIKHLDMSVSRELASDASCWTVLAR